MISFLIPILPRAVLRQSGGPAKDRAEVAEATKELMAATSHALGDLGAGLPEYERARVSVLYLCGPRRKDGRFRPDNANEAVPALRGVYQALVDAQVFPSLSWEHFRLGEHAVIRDMRGVSHSSTAPEGLFVTVEGETG